MNQADTVEQAHQPASPPATGTLRVCLWLVFLGCCGVVALNVLWHFSAFYAWDDAYMFTRYADNLLATGKATWNPGGEPTYGLTSVLYLAVVVPFHLLLVQPQFSRINDLQKSLAEEIVVADAPWPGLEE